MQFFIHNARNCGGGFILKKKIKYIIFSAALGLSIAGAAIANPDNASACWMASGSTGDITPCP